MLITCLKFTKKECKSCKERKKIISECNLVGIKNNRLHYKCKECNDETFKSINELNKKFPNTHQFCNGDVNKFVLLLRKGVYPYEYMDSWDKFNETSIPDKEAFYSKLNKEGINNADYAHVQKVWTVFKIKNFGDYHTCMFKVIQYCLQMCLKTLEINVLSFMNLILLIFCQLQDWHGKLV